MSVNQTEVIDYIKNLKLSEVKELIEKLEDELGVSASAPMMVAGAVAGGEVAAEQTEFDVVLTSFGPKKIAVIKAVRQLTGLGLKEAKTLVESAPAKIKEAVSKEDADSAKTSLEEAGASIEIK